MERLLIESLALLLFTIYMTLVAFNYKGLAVYFLKRADRNKRFVDEFILPPEDGEKEYEPSRFWRLAWMAFAGVCALVGALLFSVRILGLVGGIEG